MAQSTSTRLVSVLVVIYNAMVLISMKLLLSSAYLYGKMDQTIFMTIQAGKVLRLLRSLYGLKQAGRIWYEVLHDFLKSSGFVNSSLYRCCFLKKIGDMVIIFLVYVDDIIYTSNRPAELRKFCNLVASGFKLKDLGWHS